MKVWNEEWALRCQRSSSMWENEGLYKSACQRKKTLSSSSTTFSTTNFWAFVSCLFFPSRWWTFCWHQTKCTVVHLDEKIPASYYTLGRLIFFFSLLPWCTYTDFFLVYRLYTRPPITTQFPSCSVRLHGSSCTWSIIHLVHPLCQLLILHHWEFICRFPYIWSVGSINLINSEARIVDSVDITFLFDYETRMEGIISVRTSLIHLGAR